MNMYNILAAKLHFYEGIFAKYYIFMREYLLKTTFLWGNKTGLFISSARRNEPKKHPPIPSPSCVPLVASEQSSSALMQEKRNQRVHYPQGPIFLSFSLAQRKELKETSTLTKPPPIWGGCSWLRAEAALRQFFGKVYKAFALRVNLSILRCQAGTCDNEWKSKYHNSVNEVEKM